MHRRQAGWLVTFSMLFSGGSLAPNADPIPDPTPDFPQSIKQFPDFDDMTHVPRRSLRGTHNEVRETPVETIIATQQCFLLRRWNPGQQPMRERRNIVGDSAGANVTAERTEHAVEAHPITGMPVVYSEQLITLQRLNDGSEVIRMDFVRYADEVQIMIDGEESRVSVGMGPEEQGLWMEAMVLPNGTVQRRVSQSPTAMTLPPEVATGLRETYVPSRYLASLLKRGESPVTPLEVLTTDRGGNPASWNLTISARAERMIEVEDWFSYAGTQQPELLRSWQVNPQTETAGEYVIFERCDCP